MVPKAEEPVEEVTSPVPEEPEPVEEVKIPAPELKKEETNLKKRPYKPKRKKKPKKTITKTITKTEKQTKTRPKKVMIKKTKQKTIPFTKPTPTPAAYLEIELYKDEITKESLESKKSVTPMQLPNIAGAVEGEENADKDIVHDRVSLSSDNDDSSSEETSSDETDSQTESEESSEESENIEYNETEIEYKVPVEEPEKDINEDAIDYVDPTQPAKTKKTRKVKKKVKRKRKKNKDKKSNQDQDGISNTDLKLNNKEGDDNTNDDGKRRRRRRKRRKNTWAKDGAENEKLTIDINRNDLMANEITEPFVRESTPPKFKKGVSDKIRLMQMRFAAEQVEDET
jgi:hypothetical protein